MNLEKAIDNRNGEELARVEKELDMEDYINLDIHKLRSRRARKRTQKIVKRYTPQPGHILKSVNRDRSFSLCPVRRTCYCPATAVLLPYLIFAFLFAAISPASSFEYTQFYLTNRLLTFLPDVFFPISTHMLMVILCSRLHYSLFLFLLTAALECRNRITKLRRLFLLASKNTPERHFNCYIAKVAFLK